MKLRNKKTGEIVSLIEIINIDDRLFARLCEPTGEVFKHEIKNLSELNAEWEDYEEPKEHWYIRYDDGVNITCDEADDDMKSIGNDFETKEEAEKAVEKLKAWERLKDKGFRFNGWIREHHKGSADITIASFIDKDYDMTNDLDLLFGGEE